MRLLPWDPDGPGQGAPGADDPALTAATYHEARERAADLAGRHGALLGHLEAEIRRARQSAARAEGDRSGFEDYERYRHWGEALLAGLAGAERVGDVVQVVDPYSAEGDTIAIPVPPGQDPKDAADRYFRRYRRGERGLARAIERANDLKARRDRLDRLRVEYESRADRPSMESLEAAMRQEGIPVGLTAPTRAASAAADVERPRLEGVRIYTGPDGSTVLAGKTGKDNHRLTFRLAGPEDFWLHALGVPGAHVVIRNPDRARSPDRATLLHAAAIAAWFSEARENDAVDVQWTRRKYVRKARGAPPGTVLVKRFETVRVRPAAG
jgi:predicted ribosome quality control (RQC) complex YloA/Tae2 family protein